MDGTTTITIKPLDDIGALMSNADDVKTLNAIRDELVAKNPGAYQSIDSLYNVYAKKIEATKAAKANEPVVTITVADGITTAEELKKEHDDYVKANPGNASLARKAYEEKLKELQAAAPEEPAPTINPKAKTTSVEDLFKTLGDTYNKVLEKAAVSADRLLYLKHSQLATPDVVQEANQLHYNNSVIAMKSVISDSLMLANGDPTGQVQARYGVSVDNMNKYLQIRDRLSKYQDITNRIEAGLVSTSQAESLRRFVGMGVADYLGSPGMAETLGKITGSLGAILTSVPQGLSYALTSSVNAKGTETQKEIETLKSSVLALTNVLSITGDITTKLGATYADKGIVDTSAIKELVDSIYSLLNVDVNSGNMFKTQGYSSGRGQNTDDIK